jgi:hypothetical protein
MFKTISAALLAVSVLAAPALASTMGKTNEVPPTKSASVKAHTKENARFGAKSAIKPSVLNANARMDSHHHFHHRHYRHHIGAIKTQTKVSFKHVKPATRHG